MNTLSRHGWYWFTVLFSDTANPTWPISAAAASASAASHGYGNQTVSAGAPAGLITPTGTKLLLRSVIWLGSSDMAIALRQGDGATAYFGGTALQAAAGWKEFPNLAVPLWNGLCAISTAGTTGRAVICYEHLDF